MLLEFVVVAVICEAAPENPTLEVTRPVNVAVDPCNVPANVTPPEALIPAVNLVSALKVPPAALIPAFAVSSPLKLEAGPLNPPPTKIEESIVPLPFIQSVILANCGNGVTDPFTVSGTVPDVTDNEVVSTFKYPGTLTSPPPNVIPLVGDKLI